MKTSKTNLILTSLTLAVSLGVLAGCASKGYEKAAATSEALQAASDRINKGIAQIDASLTALTNLVNNPSGDLVPGYKKYSDEVTKLRTLATDVNDKAIAMQAKGKDYFDDWQKQLATIQNQDIRSISEARRREVTDKFQEIKASYEKVKDTFKPFMSDLESIQTYLGTDLTAGGVAAIKKTADEANEGSVPLKEAIAKLADQFREVGVSMSAAGTAPAPQ